MFLFANISFARLTAYVDCISLGIKHQEMTVECAYVQYTRAHDRMIFLLVDSARQSVLLLAPPDSLPVAFSQLLHPLPPSS